MPKSREYSNAIKGTSRSLLKTESELTRLIDKKETFFNTQYPTLLDIARVNQT